MGGIGFKEILVIALIIVILIGAKRKPELMKGLGRGIKDFKDASKGDDASKDASKEEVK